MNIEQAAFRMAHLTALSHDEPIQTDIGTVIEIDGNGSRTLHSAINSLNRKGYIPLVSMAIGGYRIAVNMIGIIVNIAMTIFLRQSPVIAAKNIAYRSIQILRGAIELLPFAGNAVVYGIDRLRIRLIENRINKESLSANTRSYYANGVQIVSGYNSDTFEKDIVFMQMCGAQF